MAVETISEPFYETHVLAVQLIEKKKCRATFITCNWNKNSDSTLLKGLELTSTTSGSCVIACPSTMLMGSIFPSRSMVFTKVSSPSSHIWATSSPTFTKPPYYMIWKKKTNRMNAKNVRWIVNELSETNSINSSIVELPDCSSNPVCMSIHPEPPFHECNFPFQLQLSVKKEQQWLDS